ncbi:MAG: hypothetical protein JNL18_22220 [Planctomycetaceae bacterium]|uniref:Uncharacterized protein n=1 Tax=Lacipirellula limnantheis TaxID=2528024 RepID=A0A517U2D8_9BACT|nr:hypothetical protein [Lacipirellula limnantheis]MBL9165459.1 hypothetical protein [Planctomycetaceae bacterium]QDT74773.1 hypothetical protein I41_39750 [Lacipirellula limnantheis]
MKRIAMLLFGLTMTVGMIGCAEKKAEPTAPAATTPAAETTPAAPADAPK